MSNSADQLLENHCFVSIVDRLEQEYFKRWQASNDSVTRELIFAELTALNLLVANIAVIAQEQGEQNNDK